MEILIVDDEVTVVSLIKKHVDWESIGIDKVQTAYNAEMAKRKVQENPIDIIICDIEMPQENGLIFLAWVKERYPDISTVILTAYPEFHYAQAAIKLGVKSYLLKPISFAELSETIRGMVKEISEQKKAAQQYAHFEEETGPEDHMPKLNGADLAESGSDVDYLGTKSQESGRSVDNSEAMVQEVMRYIAVHYADPIGRQEIAEAMHMNGDYLNRVFKAATGYSLIQYIQYYRVILAKRLMKEEHMAVVDVGCRVGMDSPSYFGKIFKKWTGQTPYEYYVQVHEKKKV